MEINLKILSDCDNFSEGCVSGYSAVIQKDNLKIKELEILKKIFLEESYSMDKIKLLDSNRIEISGEIEDGLLVVNDIPTIIQAAEEEKEVLNAMLQRVGFCNSDVTLVISEFY